MTVIDNQINNLRLEIILSELSMRLSQSAGDMLDDIKHRRDQVVALKAQLIELIHMHTLSQGN